MAAIVQQGVEIEAIGKQVTVPNDEFAKLMYYLSCMNTCLEDFIPRQYTNYQNYYALSNETRGEILALVMILEPSKLLGKVIFLLPRGHPLLNGSSNEFYKVFFNFRTRSNLISSSSRSAK